MAKWKPLLSAEIAYWAALAEERQDYSKQDFFGAVADEIPLKRAIASAAKAYFEEWKPLLDKASDRAMYVTLRDWSRHFRSAYNSGVYTLEAFLESRAPPKNVAPPPRPLNLSGPMSFPIPGPSRAIVAPTAKRPRVIAADDEVSSAKKAKTDACMSMFS